MNIRLRIMGSVACVFAGGASADLTLVPAGPAQRLDPARVAGIRSIPGGGWELTTPWTPYNGSGSDSPDTPIYDSTGGTFLLEEDGKLVNLPYSITNMKIADEFHGAASGRATMYYYWTDTGAPFYIAIFTAEDVSTDCSLPAADNPYDGIVLGFDAISNGFYYTDADTEADSLFYTMPADGRGAWAILVADDFDGKSFTLAAGPTQPALYGTSNNAGEPGRPGESTDPTWSDRDGSQDLDPGTECVSYAFGLEFLPNPLSTAIVFWTQGKSESCYADCKTDGAIDLFDFLCFTNDFNTGGPCSDCEGDGAHDLFDFLCFVNAFNEGC